MYTPIPYAHHDRAELHDCMRQWSFATLITQGAAGSGAAGSGAAGAKATHLPFLLDADDGPLGTLTTHLARNNAQLADLLAGSPALVIFQGPHAYISPSWYDNQRTFPTWNYAAIHARGQPECLESPEAVRAVLDRTVAHYDAPLGGTWRFPDMPADMIAPRLQAIVAVRIPIAALEGKFKFNQDKSPADRQGVVRALMSSPERGDQAAAEFMQHVNRHQDAA